MTVATSTACIAGAVDGTISWTRDPDFGYDTAVSCPGVEDGELLAPLALYARTGRSAAYSETVTMLLHERRATLGRYPGLDRDLQAALDGH